MGHWVRPRLRHARTLEPRGHGSEVVAGAVGPLIERAVAAGGGATGASGVKAGAVAGGRVVRRPVRVGVTVAAVGVVGVGVALRVGAGAGDLLACMCDIRILIQRMRMGVGRGGREGERDPATATGALTHACGVCSEGGRARQWFYDLPLLQLPVDRGNSRGISTNIHSVWLPQLLEGDHSMWVSVPPWPRCHLPSDRPWAHQTQRQPSAADRGPLTSASGAIAGMWHTQSILRTLPPCFGVTALGAGASMRLLSRRCFPSSTAPSPDSKLSPLETLSRDATAWR